MPSEITFYRKKGEEREKMVITFECGLAKHKVSCKDDDTLMLRDVSLSKICFALGNQFTIKYVSKW
jgi:hypothetical protein